MPEDVYERLAKHLDKALAGAPMSPALIEILKILHTEEDAEVALNLQIYENRTLAQLEEAMPEKAGRLEEMLAGMARKGTVFTEQKPGRERVYRLLPSVVGFAEAPYLDGVDTPEKRALAPLWVKYITSDFGAEMARGVPLIRVIPIAESLEDAAEVLPFDALEEKLEEATFMAVGHCPCRQIRKYVGEGCDRPTERCMHFGSLGRYIVETGLGRQIDKEEALQILRSATEEGLVHVCDNLQGSLRTICNCCPCCCGFFQAKMVAGYDTLSRSNYVARVESEECIACEICSDRCPVGAITVGETAEVDEDLCIGCGVCTPTCGADGAIRLHVREQTQAPPDLEQFMAARIKK
ncbi:MAG TPA: 4Fe-4S binding protein [Candidatus Anoxymicrobiaceae bacterium]|jgi:Na+-translocating ferredoxin:NAD+ oxidoreductase subunit B